MSAPERRGIEIEVTPAMIEAGFSVLSFSYGPDEPETVRREVVREMYKAVISAKLLNNAH